MQPLKIYECHVKGITKLCPFIPQTLRGTFLGLSHPAMIRHLKRLDINAVQLLPIFQKKESYWGYDTTSWFELNEELGSMADFEQMTETLQANGIKVILDVVYNHTGNVMPSVTYTDVDVTGCGNCVDVRASLSYIMRSISKWMSIVDGMRFDLAGALGRENGKGFNPNAMFFKRMDVFLRRGKILIAEPYDLHEQSYGRFPEGWLELNHHFRDTVRNGGQYPTSRPNDVNYICCHDGFVLNDLVAYNHKHNVANGEDNRDGSDNNSSHNFGVEGNTYNEDILASRAVHKQWLEDALNNSGTHTMWLGGDETGSNTQFGNNNAWNQDNPLGWVIWE